VRADRRRAFRGVGAGGWAVAAAAMDAKGQRARNAPGTLQPPSLGMEARPSRLDLFLADWVLGHVSAEGAVERATQALAAGCDDASIVSIASIAASKATTREEIEVELPQVLHAFGRRRPSEQESLKTLVDDCAWRIASGEVDPVQGAWRMWSFWTNEDESSEFYDQVRVFVDLVCDTPASHVAEHGDEIVAEARAFLDRGGLRLRGTGT
jgi:hypothetical protein